MGILNYSDDEVKNWLKDKTPEQIAQQASSMGLTAEQVQQGLAIGGQNVSTADITNYAANNGYGFGSDGKLVSNTSTPVKPIDPAGWKGTQQPGGNQWNINQGTGMVIGGPTGKAYTNQEIKDWFAANPDVSQWAKQAASMGMTSGEVAQAIMKGTGGAYDEKAVIDYINASGNYGFQDTGRIMNGSGAKTDFDSNGLLRFNNGGAGFGQSAGGVTGGNSGGAGGGNGAPGGGSSSSSGGTSGPGNWQVTPEQTVESRVAGILAAGNPLVTQRRAQSDMKMNARGLLNSSIAQTASDDAAYSAALDIAKPDAATYADAAKTNAGLQTTWGISQNNNQTSRDINAANIAAQKELQQATQLYNNLATQTASASSIQSWGLNTITTIQMSDLSAEAKNAAIKSVQQYLADSYQIQGDWHTSAAAAITAIFD